MHLDKLENALVAARHSDRLTRSTEQHSEQVDTLGVYKSIR